MTKLTQKSMVERYKKKSLISKTIVFRRYSLSFNYVDSGLIEIN